MALENFVLPELVSLAKELYKDKGEDALVNYNPYFDACGCMGPRSGEQLCPCKQRARLKSNMTEIVNEFNPELARKIMIRRLVAALPG